MIFVLSALWTAQAAAPKYDPEKLRSLVKLPVIRLEMGFGLDRQLGFTFGGEPLDLSKLKPPATRIAELRKEIGGGAPDAERFSELAGLYAKLNDQAQSQAAWKRSIQLFREQVRDNPKQGWLRSQLGKALLGADQRAEGENLLRDAVALAPEDWRCWEALGGFLASQAFDVLDATNSLAMSAGIGRSLRPSGSHLAASPERRAKARALCDEARSCYDKAVSVGPLEPGAYQARVCFRWAGTQLLYLLIEPERTADSPPSQSLFPAEAVADLNQVAKLTTNDAYAIGMAASVEATKAMSSIPKEAMSSNDIRERGFWPFLPDSARTYVREAMSRLEQLGRNEDKAIAGGALAALGGLQLIVRRDPVAAKTNLRRSTELRPAADCPWELLGLVLVQSERWQDLAALGEERLKSKDSVRYRIVLAKAYERLGKTTEVEKHVQAALKLAPNDLLANTALAALRLKHATDDALAQVGEMMAQLKQSAFKAAPQEQQMGFEFLHGLYFGLAGNREEAASHFRRLREVNPDEATYREAYDALGL